jgi:hypothetical protein
MLYLLKMNIASLAYEIFRLLTELSVFHYDVRKAWTVPTDLDLREQDVGDQKKPVNGLIAIIHS